MPSSRRVSSRLKAVAEPKDDVDSAYGSKEDSLVEDELQVAQPVPTSARSSTRRKTASLKSKESLEIPETPGNATTRASTSSKRRSKRVDQPPASEDEGVAPSAPRTGPKRKDTQHVGAEDEGTLGRSSTKRRHSTKQAEIVTEPEIEESEDELQAEVGSTPARDRSARSLHRPRRCSPVSQSTREPSPAPSRSRRAVGSAANSPRPKGILTPSKGQRAGPRKSVLFDQDEIQVQEQLGFKDIDTSVKKTQKSARATDVSNLAVPNDDETALTGMVNNDPLLDFDEPADILSSLEPVASLPIGDSTVDSPAVASIKAQVLGRLTSATSCSPAPHLATQQSALTNLLTSTVVSGESNSLLLLGPRGAGKTLLLEHILEQLNGEHSPLFHTVRLNGFFQTDDRLALREIWRQLGRTTQDENGEEANAAPISYADTLASLLSLLSHPDEMDLDTESHEDPEVDPEAPTRTAKSVIIILDEFDLFTLHPRQTLLYNLFDIAQSRKAPIAVIGCSTRMDVVESLEKRVKSRFSHRWLHIPPVRTLAEMKTVVEKALIVDSRSAAVDFVERLEEHNLEETKRWNKFIQDSFMKSEAVSQLISQTFYTTKSVPEVLSALYAPVATLALPTTNTSKISAETTARPPIGPLQQTLLSLAVSLPTLHLSLLAALSSPSYPSPLPSFHTTYAHYIHLVSRTRIANSSSRARTTGAAASLRQWGYDMCQGAWEELLAWSFLVHQGRSGEGGAVDEWEGVRAELEPEEILWSLKQRDAGESKILATWITGEVV
ncbi:uncharacterized protein HMPREF1541_01393 [Cyphellophora europaea CBS 101466]|uniref:Origin recognition complex subunit 4 n=1 Tax=Cyphellophora europaea (strain CBS 101466) TaxID=1220924 RepID=W2SET0_CYPE1|nr:uncharacterized protein HMPREF1541_01393 [Cyphellophora europaea CBS 101466]ETN47202.1 hypothetical protein HMPREF1541_01393 [Cyphellophora europaea CBS 101466]